MFYRKTLHKRTTALFRWMFLYAVTLTFTCSLAFSLFYYRIHTLILERMDRELLEEVEEFSAVMAENGVGKIKAKIAQEGESEDPDEEFCRLIGFDGKVFATTDMSSWGNIDRYGSLARARENQADRVFQTLTIPERDYKGRMVSAVIGFNAVLQIGETLKEAEDYLKIFRDSFHMLLIIVVILTTVSGWFFAKKALLDSEEVAEDKNARMSL